LAVQTTVSYALYRQTTSEDSPTSRAEDKNEWSYTSTPVYAFMAWRWENV